MTENQHVEYKQLWRDDYLKWICGFANAQGGVLEIGKNDKGEVIGLADASRLLEELPNKMRDTLGIIADVDLLTENGKSYIRIIEAWGRGIERMLQSCAAAGLPAPELRHEHVGLWVIFHFMSVDKTKTPVKTPVKTPEMILEVLAANPRLSLAEVAATISKSLSAVERASAKLVKEGRLRFVGPRKGGYWEVIGDEYE